MNTFTCFETDTAIECLALHMLAVDQYPTWLASQPASVRDWLDGSGFKAEAGQSSLVPSASGKPAFAIALIADPLDPVSYGHLPQLLANKTFQLAKQSPLQVNLQALVLGWGLGAYRFNRYLKKTKPTARLQINPHDADTALALDQLSASYLVRDLINTPTEDMGPEQLEAQTKILADRFQAKFNVVLGEKLLKQNFPAIHAVGRASHRPPRLLELHWGDKTHPHLVIVGKGVCFDTGGLDIKGGEGMRHMKKDMGGSAHALGLAQLIMQRQLPLRLSLLIPAVENAIGPNAYRPGEVLNTRQGLTVEIDNTDAEGRVILGDALSYAAEFKPQLIMDFATLTGAARIALGPDLPVLFSNNDKIADNYLSAGIQQRDPLWRMPLWRPYLSYLKSSISDMANAGGSKMAGCITAALYLERFIPEGQDWTHVDVHSWNDSDRPAKPAGGEAQGLRAAYELCQLMAQRKHK